MDIDIPHLLVVVVVVVLVRGIIGMAYISSTFAVPLPQDCHAWRFRRTPILICRVMARRVDKPKSSKLLRGDEYTWEMGYVFFFRKT